MLTYSRRNLDFLLNEVEEILKLTDHPYYQSHNQETFSLVLDTAEVIAEKYLRPFLKETDQHPPQLIDGHVIVHPAIKEFYQQFCESGLMTACFEEKFGGQQLPKTVYAASDFIIGNAHNGFEMFTGLASAAARLLITFGSETLIQKFALKILSGEYAATMCLTETQAGSSLNDVATLGIRQPDGTYKMKGQKIFISAGAHDVTEIIVHLVLARTPEAPAGTKGLSLFAVPTRRDHETQKVYNDVSSIAVYHKMGQKSTPAMHLEFGAKGDCIGYLIGEEKKGLEYMFQMMNASRLGVGMAGIYIACSAYYHSLQYAKERIQGKRLGSDKTPESCPIIQHPDVRRMLFFQKAIVEGALGFIFYCHHIQDLEKVSTGEEKLRYSALLELLTPVAKTFGSEMGIQSVQQGMQVLGGYGYTEDFILEQLSRDVRIMSIYEGTTGIQAQALLGRQIPLKGGQSFTWWKEEVMKDIHTTRDLHQLETYGGKLLETVLQFENTTNHLLKKAQQNNAEVFLSDATLYMECFGIITVAWQWLRQGIAAQRALKNKDHQPESDFYSSKLHTMKYFFHYELIKTKALFVRLMDEEVITLFGDNEYLV